MMLCLLVLMVLMAVSCKARYIDDDLEEAKALDKRRAMVDKVFKRGFGKRQKKLIHFLLHYIDQ